MINPMSEDFRRTARQLQEELMNEVDNTVNKATSKIIVQMFQFSKQTKIDLIQKIDYNILTSRITTASSDELIRIKDETMEKLDQFLNMFQDINIIQEKRKVKVCDDRWRPPVEKKRNTTRSKSKEPTYQQPTLKAIDVNQNSSDTETHQQETFDQMYQCPACPREFYRMASTVKHLLINHSNKDEYSICPYCGRQDKSSDFVAQHMMELHHTQSKIDDGFSNLKDLIQKMGIEEYIESGSQSLESQIIMDVKHINNREKNKTNDNQDMPKTKVKKHMSRTQVQFLDLERNDDPVYLEDIES